MAKQKIDYLERILQKKYTALYLTRTKKILRTNNVKSMSIIRFTHFGDEPVYVCGIKHCVQFLKNIKGEIKVYGVKDGTLVKPGDPILLIKGDYSAIAEYESVIDGIIARESSICNNTKQILKIIKTKQLIYMGDRADLYLTQPYDGYAAYVGGLRIFTTEAHADFINDKKIKIVGTIPHALIQQFNGNLSKALWFYHKTYPNEPLSALVDYHNDVVGEIKKIDKKLKPLISTIRIDTSSRLHDKSLPDKKQYYGVCKRLVLKARTALDACGMKHVKIIVSSGFDLNKIKSFVKSKIPVDIYGVGGSIVKVNVNITGDLIYLNNKQESKAGRFYKINQKTLKKLNIYI